MSPHGLEAPPRPILTETKSVCTQGLLPAVGLGCVTALLVRRPLGVFAGIAVGAAAYAVLRRRACEAAVAEREAALDETLDESFPSSDPPSYSGATA
jgi:hypothetical protein